jgi:hypothetical protein
VTNAEPPVEPDSGESAGGFAGTLNSTPKVIGAITALIGAVTGLLIALNKVGFLGDGEGGGGGTTTTEEAEGLFQPIERPSGRVQFDGKTMYVRVNSPRAPLVHLADQGEALQDVAMSSRVQWVSGSDDYGFSLLCRYRNPKNYYLLGVLSGGRYNIARYRNGQLTRLTRGSSTLITQRENDVTVRCVGESPTTLTLEVNGRRIGQVTDPAGLPGGNIGFRVGTGGAPVTTSFEDFLLNHF